MSEMWNERMFVVVTRDENSGTMQAIAGFTTREDAQSFCDAQPRRYVRESAREQENRRLQRRGDPLLPTRWIPTDGLGVFGGDRKIDFFISEVAWNPNAAAWPLTEAEISKDVLVLQDPSMPPYTAGDTLPAVPAPAATLPPRVKVTEVDLNLEDEDDDPITDNYGPDGSGGW